MGTIEEVLTPKSTDDQGRTYYEPEHLTVKQTSQYNKSQYEFYELPGMYWESRDALSLDAIYEVSLTSKSKPAGPRTKEGSMYLDIREAVLKGHNALKGDSVYDMPPPLDSDFTPAPAPGATERAPEAQGAWTRHSTHEPSKDPIQERIEKGMAFNAAYTIFANDPKFSYDDADAILQIRAMRDGLYHRVILIPVAAPHYCYEHEQDRQTSDQKPGQWWHTVEGGWCDESRGFVAKEGE